MTARRRRLLVIASALAGLAALAGIGTWWLLYTQPGAKWGFERLGGFFPGRLDARDMKGPLRGPIEIHHFTYRNDRLAITADRVFIDWRLRDLWRRRLDIRHIYGENVRVVIGGPGDTPQAEDSLRGPLPDLNLPVTMIVRDGLVRGLTLARPGSDSGVVIDTVALDARSMRRDSLHVNRLAVRSKLVDLDFAGVAMPRGAYPLTLRGTWIYRLPRGAPVRGEGTLSGTLDNLIVRQRLTGPFLADVDMRFIRPLRRTRYEGNVSFYGLTPRELIPSAPPGTFHGRIRLNGDSRVVSVAGSASGTNPDLGATAASFRVRHTPGLYRIDDLVVSRPGSRGQVRVECTVRGETRRAPFDLGVAWTDVGWPLRGRPWFESARGSGRVRGTWTNFSLNMEALVAGRDLPPGRWTLDGHGGNGRLAVRTVIANILDGRITGRGTVGWTQEPRWDLTFEGQGINPGRVWPAYPGALAFAGRTQGVHTKAGASGRVLVSRLNGTLRNQPIAASGTVTAHAGQYQLTDAMVRSGPNRVDASGGFGRAFSLAWKIDAPQIGAVLAQSSGSLRGEGTLRGTKRNPRIAGTLAGDSLFVGRFHAATLRADGDVDLRPGGVVLLHATALQLNAGTHAAERATLTARGTRESHQWHAVLAGRQDSTVVAFAGGFGAGGWRGQLSQLDLVHPRSGKWSLAGPATLSWLNGRVDVSGFAWQSGSSRILLTADWRRGGPWHVDSRLEQVDLTLLQPSLPPRIRLQGAMAGHVVAHGTEEGRIFADLDIAPGPGSVLYQSADGRWIPVAFQNASLRATADGVRATIMFGADLVGNGTVRGTINWPAYGSFAAGTSRPLDGALAVHLTDLGIIQGFTSELDATSGALDADFTIAGTVQNPFLYGPLTLRNGGANIPRYGLRLREMNVTGRGSQGGQIVLDGTVRSGTGVLTLHGTAAVARGARPVAEVSVKGDRVQAINTRDMDVLASPDLRFKLNGNRLDITGEIVIQQGTIDIGQADSRRLVKASPDVVYAGADTLESTSIETHSRVRIAMGDQVRVTGFGLDVRPTGSVVAIDAPGLPTLGNGRLDIKDGTYRIYGQDLNVEAGTLIFGGGPIINPAVRARAMRTAADGVVAGFIVSGTVMKPDVQVFSEPAMSQSQALSYVMFGKPIESANLSEGQIASTLATTMGVPGTNFIAQGVASELGIEQARIDVGTTLENTSVSLGTHLSPKLYVNAGVDVFQQNPSLTVRYILNRLFTVEAETSRRNRVDLLYTIEP
jgi:translocation and assembly module TamB